jgi:very-short-patch-repair endonuclease
MANITPTKQTIALVEALQKRGVELQVEYWDGHKHVDIYIPKDNLYIEIDGLDHQTKPERIISDFNRDYFSFKNGFFTKRITNESIESHLEAIADAISHVAKNAPNKIGKNLHPVNPSEESQNLN